MKQIKSLIINKFTLKMIPQFMTEKYRAPGGIKPDTSQLLVKHPNH